MNVNLKGVIEKAMNFNQVIFATILSFYLILGAGCTSMDVQENLFVYNHNEFNRETYTLPSSEPNSITICYNKYGTSPVAILNLAVKECGKYNKTAEFIRQSYIVCPIFTPIAAIYNCCTDLKNIPKDKDLSSNLKINKCNNGKR